MKDVILVPAWERPEMLYWCLKRLLAAEFIDSCEVWVLLDAHQGWMFHENPQFDQVISYFPELKIRLTRRQSHGFVGNSKNVIMGFREALESGCQYCFLVEDDVMVAHDFLRWHRSVMQQGKWFASIGTYCTRRNDWPKDGKVNQFWVSDCDYASLGVCLPRETLRLVAAHDKTEYYLDPVSYLLKYFANSRFKTSFHEQDGLIMRLIGHVSGQVAWPCVPRAWHVGFWGYHRRDRKPMWEGSGLADKIRFCGDLLSSPASLEKAAAGSYGDVFAPDDTRHEWEQAELIARLS